MRALPFVLSLVALVVASAALAAALTAESHPSATSAVELEERIERLERALADRAAAERSLATDPHPGAPRHPRRGATSPDLSPREARATPASAATAPGDGSASGATTDPATFLRGWLRTFDDSGTGAGGAEFFRLAVDAFAADLLPDLRALLSDDDQPAALRAAVAGIVAQPRFDDDVHAQDGLLDALRSRPDAALAEIAAKALARSGDARRATELEALLPSIADAGARTYVVAALATLAREHANASLRRLFASETHPGVRGAIVSALSDDGDEASALDVIRSAAQSEHSALRTRAADRLGLFRSDAARAELDAWLGRETDRAVVARLRSARAAQDSIPKYHALRATGAPDVPNPPGDHENAWCPRSENGGPEWLELTYEHPLHATRVVVHQVYRAGAVVRIELADAAGHWSTAWEVGDDVTDEGHTLVADVRRPGRVSVSRVRVTLDTSLVSGWHEIDAVGIADAETTQWATGARASSTWQSSPGAIEWTDPFED